MIHSRYRAVLAATLLGLALTPDPICAAEPSSSPLFANTYWEGFKQFWTGRLKRTDGVVLTAVGVGAVSLFIITRGRWKK